VRDWLVEQRGGRHDLPGCTVAALKCIALQERHLHRVQDVSLREAFDGSNLAALLHDGERQTGVDADAVNDYGAGAALAVVAAFFGAGEVEVLAKCVQQSDAQIERKMVRFTVDRERDVECLYVPIRFD